MKITKKMAIALFGVFTFFSIDTKAQVSAGVNLGVFKSFTEGSEAQFGFNLSGKYAINEKIRVGANFGYAYKTYDVLGIKLRAFVMPITGLFEYSFNDNAFSPYAGADVGLYRFGLTSNGKTLAEGYFGFAPVVGFNYEISDNVLLNSNFKYHYVFTEGKSTSAIGFNAGIFYSI